MKLERRSFIRSGAAAIGLASAMLFGSRRSFAQQGSSPPAARGAAATGSSERGLGIVVPEHFVPTPRTISPQAQAFLSHVSPVQAASMPSRDDKEGWRAYREAASGGMIALIKPYADRYPGD